MIANTKKCLSMYHDLEQANKIIEELKWKNAILSQQNELLLSVNVAVSKDLLENRAAFSILMDSFRTLTKRHGSGADDFAAIFDATIELIKTTKDLMEENDRLKKELEEETKTQ